MSTIMDGKLVSLKIKEEIKQEVIEIKEKYKKAPKLVVIIVGDNSASQLYVRNKRKTCIEVGIESEIIAYNNNTKEEEIESKIKELGFDKTVDGILLQLPLPEGFDSKKLIKMIPKNKDVDGLTSENIASLIRNEEGIVPCTPLGILDMLNYYNIPIEGQKITIIGRSMLVGKPLFSLLTNNNATVTLCHSKTKNIKEITLSSDAVVLALGQALFLKEDMIKPGTVVVDAGINRIEGKLYGDADFENIKDKASYITPVPGGCGVMTVIELMKNTIKCFKLNNK